MSKARESPPPTKWIRSHSGTPARIAKTTKKRDDAWLYRLHFSDGIRGNALWTLNELKAQRVRFLKNKPADWI